MASSTTHNGAMESSFPKFSDGDVHIIISGSRQYRLHSTILRGASETLDELLDEDKAANLSKKALRRGVTIRFRLMLCEAAPGERSGLAGNRALVRHDLNAEGIPIHHRAPIPLDLENGLVPNQMHVAFNSVFGAIYSLPIDFGETSANSTGRMLEIAQDVSLVAAYLQCLHIVTKSIEATLLSHGQKIFVSIANQPLHFLRFGALIRSRMVFREALIVAAGMSNSEKFRRDATTMLSDYPEIKAVLERKGKQLKEKVRDAFYACSQYCPPSMTRISYSQQALTRETIGRESYQADIFLWMAVFLVRQWMTQQVFKDLTHHAEDLGYAVVRRVATDASSFVSKEEVAAFHEVFPMSQKGKNITAGFVEEVKLHFRKRIAPLWSNESSLDPKILKVPYLTCTQVDDARDYPWLDPVPESDEMETGSSDGEDGEEEEDDDGKGENVADGEDEEEEKESEEEDPEDDDMEE